MPGEPLKLPLQQIKKARLTPGLAHALQDYVPRARQTIANLDVLGFDNPCPSRSFFTSTTMTAVSGSSWPDHDQRIMEQTKS